MRFIVTVKVMRDPDHSPGNRETGPCLVSGRCTNSTGSQHSFLVEAANEAELRDQMLSRGWYVVRVEDPWLVTPAGMFRANDPPNEQRRPPELTSGQSESELLK